MKSHDLTRILLASMMILTFAFVGCSDDDSPTDPGTAPTAFQKVADYTDEYLTDYTSPNLGLGVNIAAGDFATAYFPAPTKAPNTDDFFVIDWRSEAVYANAHIEGAVNWKLTEIIDHVEADELPTDKTIINYCYSGQSASIATSIINMLGQELGYDAQNLKFGASGWTSVASYVGMKNTSGDYITYMDKTTDDYAGMMVDTDFPKPAAGDYPTFETSETEAIEILKARFDAFVNGQLNNNGGTSWNNVSIGALAPDLTAGTWFVANYFPDTEYEAGHLPTAMQYVPKASLSTSTFLNTLPTADMKIAVYCWTGQTSAQVTTALAAMGYDAYSVLYGVQQMCYSDTTINTHPYSTPTTDYPMIGTGVGQ